MNSRTWKTRTRRDDIGGAAIVAATIIALISCTTDHTRRGYLEHNLPYLDPPQRVVIVVPGFGVTRLFDPQTNHYVWGTPRSTVHKNYPDDLDLPVRADGTIGRDRLVPRGYVGSRGPVNVGWQLTEALHKYAGYERGVNVYPFDYDFRLPAAENADKLGALIASVSPDRKVDIVTHSAGALVALAYVKLRGGGSSVQNLIMIAPTRRGVADAFRVFVRPERFLRREFSPRIVATWPFVPELLPEDGRFVVSEDGKQTSFDAWQPESWRTIIPPDVRDAFARSLADAQRFREALRTAPMPAGIHVTVMAGDCVPTARRVLARADGTYVFYRDELTESERALVPALFEDGDGTVPVSSTRVDADPILFCDGHQGLASDPNVHRALIRILRETK